MNRKVGAWDLMGADFWEPSYYSGPSNEEIARFLKGANAGDEICVLGASTIELVRQAQERKIAITVLDFSKGMIDALRDALGSNGIKYIQHDLLSIVPKDMMGAFKLVLSDRLVNRFDAKEMPLACANMIELASNNGIVRHKIRLGFYERDISILEAGRLNGTLREFYFPVSNEIDYSMAKSALAGLLAASGNVSADKIREFHFQRGREKRPTFSEIVSFHEKISDVYLAQDEVSSANSQDIFFDFKRVSK